MKAAVMALVVGVTLVAGDAVAQTRRPAPPPPPARRAPRPPAQTWGLRAFGDVGIESFAATDTFTAIFGEATAPVVGGGAEVLMPHGWFSDIRVSRIRKTGDRVFVFGGEVFHLGIPTTLTLTPFEITGGYRWVRPRARVVPYAGAGVGAYRYQERGRFAAAGDDVSERFTGYHVRGGAEVRTSRWLRLAGEVEWSGVPDAIGQTPRSAAAAFSERNLGGTSVRGRIVVGR